MTGSPANSAAALAAAVLAFLPHAADAELRDKMERHFFEPAPRRLIARLNPPALLEEALDYCAELDDVWDLGEGARAASISAIRERLDKLVAAGGESTRVTQVERAVFRDLLKRGSGAFRALPRVVTQPLRRRVRVVYDDPPPQRAYGMLKPELGDADAATKIPHMVAA